MLRGGGDRPEVRDPLILIAEADTDVGVDH